MSCKRKDVSAQIGMSRLNVTKPHFREVFSFNCKHAESFLLGLGYSIYNNLYIKTAKVYGMSSFTVYSQVNMFVCIFTDLKTLLICVSSCMF